MSENNNKEDLTNKNKFFYVLSFIPFANLAVLFQDIEEDELLKKFLTQGLSLLGIFMISTIVFPIIGLSILWKFIFLAYFFLSIYLAGNAYNGHYKNLSFLNKFSSLFKGDKKDEE